MVVGTAFMVMILFIGMSGYEISKSTNDKAREALKDIIFRNEREISLANEALNGYQRTYKNPLTAEGMNYNLSIHESELTGSIEGYEFLLIISPVNGTPKPGKNKIMNIQGHVCLNEGCTEFDTQAPAVVSAEPQNQSEGVDVKTLITAEFDDSMDETSLAAAFTVSGVIGTVTYNDTLYTATFRPAENLKYNTTYTARITTEAKDKAGNRLNKTYEWQFTTGKDTDAPGQVSGLRETHTSSSSITWNWTNPPDSDYSHAEIWIDNSFITNTSGESYTLTGLIPGSSHEIGIITTDTRGNRNTNWANDTANTTEMYAADLWELWTDRPQPVDFTSGINSTANTFGAENGNDGWDWQAHTYDNGSTYYGNPDTKDIVSFNSTEGEIKIILGGFGDPSPKGPAYNDPISAAYGVQFNITEEMFGAISNGGTALLEFDWKSEDPTGIEHEYEAVWIKARFWNKSGAHYLGSNLDGDTNLTDDNELNATTDATNEIYYRLQPNGASATGHYKINVSKYISGAGNYYADFGGKLSDWSAPEEVYYAIFDNINLTITP